MQSRFKWRWAYLPVILVLGLIWYEFWASGIMSNGTGPAAGPAEPLPQVETQAATGPTVVAVVTPAPEPPKPAEPVKVIDPLDRLLKDPPLISISVQNATFRQTVDALNKALGSEMPITLNGGGPDNKLITLDLKDQPFWDVFQAIEAQGPFEFQEGGRGMALRNYGQGIRNFERKGAAILYATQFVYTRNASGQARPGDVAPPRMQLTLLAAVDPRVHVTRHSQIMVQSAEDDTGQLMDLSNMNNNLNLMNNESNCWQQGVTWAAPEKMGKKMTRIVCLYQFTAVGGEAAATLDDIENKKDQSFDFGDRRLKLARCEMTNNRLAIQVTPADEMPEPTKTSMTVEDGKGSQVGTIQGLNGQVPATSGPYKLTVKGSRAKDVAVSFELHDITIP